MARTYFLFAHSAQKDLQRTTTTIARLERGVDAPARLDCRSSQAPRQQAVPDRRPPVVDDDLQKQAADLQAQPIGSGRERDSALQKQLDETNARLKRVEQEGDPRRI